MKKKIITLCMVLVLALSAVVMTGCNLVYNVGTIEWVEKPATTYTVGEQNDLTFKIKMQQGKDAAETIVTYPDDKDKYKITVSDFTTKTVGRRKATVTCENLKLTFIYEVVDGKFAGGTGEDTNPYKVSTKAQFQNMLDQTSFAYYELTNTINFTGDYIRMANKGVNATSEEAWVGVVDGKGYSVIGISDVRTHDGQNTNKFNEMFGRVSRAGTNTEFTLKNITFAFASTGTNATTSLVTSNGEGGEILFENVKLTGYINAANSGNTNVSPFITYIKRSSLTPKSVTLKNCSSDLKILNAYANHVVSGFVSSQTELPANSLKFENCTFNGLIEGSYDRGVGVFYTNTNKDTKAVSFTNCTIGEKAEIVQTSGLEANADEKFKCGYVSLNGVVSVDGILGKSVDDLVQKRADDIPDLKVTNNVVTATVANADRYEIYVVGSMSYTDTTGKGGGFRFVQPATARENGKLEYTLKKIKYRDADAPANENATYGTNLIVEDGNDLVYYGKSVCMAINVTEAKLVVVAYSNNIAIAIGTVSGINLAA